MDTDRTAAHLGTVQDDIICFCTYLARIGVDQRKILFHRHGKWMVHCHITVLFLRVLKQRELSYPQELEVIFL